MQTNHKIFTADSRKMSVSDGSVDLVVTSPPYPMICQWDDAFVSINTLINDHLEHDDGMGAFDLMHKELYKTWAECNRVMKDGAIACINIGDACRTIGGRFRIFPNHYRVIENMLSLGFDQLPGIIWRKPTSSRTSYYGSGTLPVGAYVKYESEYILIFRKVSLGSLSLLRKSYLGVGLLCVGKNATIGVRTNGVLMALLRLVMV
jgi:DNA modification methylase